MRLRLRASLRGLTRAEKLERAVQLYVAGHAFTVCTTKVGVWRDTLKRELEARGIPLRDDKPRWQERIRATLQFRRKRYSPTQVTAPDYFVRAWTSAIRRDD
jgi:hypothetical protein